MRITLNDLPTIEIINNTRGGIVMFIQAKKRNASNGGQIQVPDVYSCSHW